MDTQTVGLILAGGEGKRFWPLEWSKPLTNFLGKSILQRICGNLVQIGINEIIIVTNKKDKQKVEEIKIPNINIQTIIQNEPLGMADAVLTAKELLQNKSSLIVNADDITDNTLFEALRSKISEKQSFIVGKKLDNYIDVGYLKLENGNVIGIVEKPGQGNEPSPYANLVFDYFHDTTAFIEILSKTKSVRDNVFELALTEYIGKYPSKLLDYSGIWLPLKYPWHMLDLMKYFLESENHQGNHPEVVKSNVTIEGKVYFEEGVKIFENSKIVGPCYIGKNVIIGNNSIVRESHIGAGSVIGFNSDVTRSYLGENCWLHSNYIGDSVLSDNVSLGSGSVLANYRLDEKNISSNIDEQKINTGRSKLGAIIGPDVRIGVQSSTMPGIKIGQNSFLGAGITLDKDLKGNSFCMLNSGSFTVTENRTTITDKSREHFKNLLK